MEALQAADYQRAATLLTTALARVRALDDREAIAGALRNLAALAPRQGHAAEAATLLAEALSLEHARDEREGRVDMQRAPAHLAMPPALHERTLAAGAENAQFYRATTQMPGTLIPGISAPVRRRRHSKGGRRKTLRPTRMPAALPRSARMGRASRAISELHGGNHTAA